MEDPNTKWYEVWRKGVPEVWEQLKALRPSQQGKRADFEARLAPLEAHVLTFDQEKFLAQRLGPFDTRDQGFKDYTKLVQEIREAASPHIEIEDCQEGFLYRVHCRNSNCGIWLPKDRAIQIARTKFNSDYLFEEYHWDTGPPFGTARPLAILEPLPVLNSDTETLEYLLGRREKLKDSGEHY